MGCAAKAEKEIDAEKKEAETKVQKAKAQLMASKLTLKDAESEICDKSRTASELSNKHQTPFSIGMVKEVRGKADTKPKFVDPETWKKKLCDAVHNDVQRMAGIKAAEFLTQ